MKLIFTSQLYFVVVCAVIITCRGDYDVENMLLNFVVVVHGYILLAHQLVLFVLVSKITLSPTFLFKIFLKENGDIDCQINLL